ncbi:lysozyme inhibitor LprI family protein [Neisseriaceae bacterium JH1-16]|nr:lysozyme inhibitor LprI family protein [Neisseriaceae bacterium JH1-16]
MNYLYAVLLCVACIEPVQAADALHGADHQRCLNQAGSTQAMVECNDQEFRRQDVRLNRAYRAAIAAQPDKRKAALQQVQRQWLRYRDANCHFLSDPDGGSLARVTATQCMVTMTATRATELEQLLGP